MSLDCSNYLHLSFLLFSLYYFFHHHVNELLQSLFPRSKRDPLLANKYGPATGSNRGDKVDPSNPSLPCLSVFNIQRQPYWLTDFLLLTSYFLLLTSYFLLTSYHSGGEYRIRTDDPLLAKQVL
jgi:hypothetical protein